MSNGFSGWASLRSADLTYVNVQDQKASGTNGGTFTSGADRTRDLNTMVSDSSGVASLASNQLTLPAGRWRYSILATAHACDMHQAFLYNATTSTTIQRGTTCRAGATVGASVPSSVAGVVTLTTPTVLEVRHRCQTTRATDGFGLPASFGTEVYTVAEFWKDG